AMGVALSDPRLVAEELENRRLVIPFDIALPGENAYYLIYPEERRDQPKVMAFREWLLAEVTKASERSGAVAEESPPGTRPVG
nr:transcriptional regulator [Burkholderiales bacterium]